MPNARLVGAFPSSRDAAGPAGRPRFNACLWCTEVEPPHTEVAMTLSDPPKASVLENDPQLSSRGSRIILATRLSASDRLDALVVCRRRPEVKHIRQRRVPVDVSGLETEFVQQGAGS